VYWEIITDFKILVYDSMMNVMSIFMFCARIVIALSNWRSTVVFFHYSQYVCVGPAPSWLCCCSRSPFHHSTTM